MKYKARTHEGLKMVTCICKDCPSYVCFTPHNLTRGERKHDGSREPKAENWVCATNRGVGCPPSEKRKKQ